MPDVGADRRRRVRVHALAGPPRAQDLARLDPGRRPAVRRACSATPGPARTTTRWRTSPSRRPRSTRSSRPRFAPRPGARSTSTRYEVSELWATFAAVAAGNPHAWSRVPYSPEEIRTPAADNRDGHVPVPEADVRQHRRRPGGRAPAVLVRGGARDAGVPDERLVFPLAAADAHDHYFFSERESLAASPAIAAAGERRARRGRDRRRRRGRASTSTRASPPRCRSRWAPSGFGGPAGGDPRPLTVTGGLGVRRRPRQQLPDARDRGDGRGVPAGPGLGRHGQRARLVRHQALDRPVLDRPARARLHPCGLRRRPRRTSTRFPAESRPAPIRARPPSRRPRSSFERDGAPAVGDHLDAHSRGPTRARQHARLGGDAGHDREGVGRPARSHCAPTAPSIRSTPDQRRLPPAVPVGDVLDRVALRRLEVARRCSRPRARARLGCTPSGIPRSSAASSARGRWSVVSTEPSPRLRNASWKLHTAG